MQNVTSEIEIEFKSKINALEYNKIYDKYVLKGTVIKQINYYFDTEDFYYEKNEATIRIRHKNNKYILTKKSGSKPPFLEQSINISEDKAIYYIKNGLKIDVEEIDLNKDLKLITSLETVRLLFPYRSGLLCLDKSSYGKKVEYEIEFEVQDVKDKKEFYTFMEENNLIYTSLASKRERAFKEAKNNENI